jgi:tetratricopeptide (TPR) repeat protein
LLLIDKPTDFYMLSLMRPSLAVLTKQAIEAALKQDWKLATKLNSEILGDRPNNIDAKIRLGRAYIQLKEFTKAKKIFKEVLIEDPINAIALRNLELAKSGKTECVTTTLKIKSLLKEPGTTQEMKITIKARGIDTGDFMSGEELPIKVKKKNIELFKCKKGKNTLIGTIEDTYTVKKVNCLVDKKERIQAVFAHGKGNEMWILLKASAPVFKPDKIDIRPYIKKGTIDEPEIDPDSETEEEID